MKAKIYLLGLTAVTLLAASSCKPKQNAYQQVYEVAKAKPIVYAEPVVVPENDAENDVDADVEDERPIVTTRKRITQQPVVPDIQPQSEPANFRRERLTATDGGLIQRYSVVIGSFSIKTNASSLKERMQKEGYRPVIAQNAQGLYRVLIASFSDRASAVEEKERIKEKYELNDAWLLEQDL